MTFCASWGSNMSRMMARETTTPEPVDMPCKALNKSSSPMLSDKAQPTELSVKSAMPPSTTGRRPKLSANAP